MRMPAVICRWPRRAIALAGAVLVVACIASSCTAGSGSHPATQSAVAASADGCRSPVGSEPAPDGKIVLGVISLGRDFLQPTVPVHQGWWRYWQKQGLEILDGQQTVTITVPKDWRNRAAITWGANAGIVSTLRLPGTLLTPGCPAGPLKWNGYAGGFYLRSSSACVPLVFAVGRRSAVVHVGVGRPCSPVP
jgi:hypothetical protein